MLSSQAQSPHSLSQVGHWQGDLYLQFAQKDSSAKTVLATRRHQGPFTVQRPFYPEGSTCHTILLHPPGGLVEGDVLNLRVDCDEQAHSLIVTPSAGKVYECTEHAAAQQQLLNVAAGGKLEWFPQEMILYDRSISQLETTVYLEKDAQFAGWEMVCFGRPIAEDYFQQGSLRQCLSIYRDKQPVLIERTEIEANTEMMTGHYGMANFKGMASFFMTGAKREHLDIARDVVDQRIKEHDLYDEIRIGITLIDDVIVARVLMNQSHHAKQLLAAIWSNLRLPILAKEPCEPRIWAT